MNATPDSFFDGGRHALPDQAMTHGLELLAQGAHLLDLGAESTRPGSAPLGATMEDACNVEMARLLPVLAGLRAAQPEAVLCVDTCHGLTARKALALGADVINDVSACGRDPSLLEVLATYKPGYVLMHGGDKGGTSQVSHSSGVDETAPALITDRVIRFFETQLSRLINAGVPEANIVLDPGIGFGKTNRESAQLLCDMDRLLCLCRPLYVGLSMKSLFGELFGLPLAERGEATRIAVALLAARGVHYHRVHDIAPAVTALGLAQMMG